MLKNGIFKLCILLILITFTASGDYTVNTNGNISIPSLSIENIASYSIDNNGNISRSYITLNNSDFKGEPSYIVEVHASSNRVNTDNPFSMGIFISGVGDVDFAKLRVFIPKYIVKEEDTLKHKYVKVKQVFFDPLNPDVAIKSTSDDQEPAFNTIIENTLFLPRNIVGFHNFGETNADFINNSSEGNNNPPYNVSFTISPDAPAGDHNINVNLFYKSNGKWYSDTQTIPLHINYWYENEIWQYAIIIALIASIISAVADLPYVINILRRVYKKILPYIKRILHFFI